MTAQNVAFWILAIAMGAGAIGVVRSKNIVHAALFLIVVLVGAAAQYIVLLVNAFGHDEIKLSDELLRMSRTGPVADSIFRNFVVPFEVVSLLLLAALVG